MAFKIGNNTVIHDADATAAIKSSSDLDILQINGTDVLTHVGGTITLKNVTIEDAAESTINTDNITEGSTNLFFTNARAVSALASTTSALAADIVTNTTAIALNTGNINTKLPLAGGTLTGALTLSGAPSSANHATTKAYVDTAVSSGVMADTDSLAEGSSNLYYTDARVSSYLSTNNFSTEAYADTAEADAISTAATDATTKADAALVDAKAYTDTRETAITSAYQSYADQAEVDAKAYTDTEVAAIVDGAPGTLDTLNELAAALGDDANLSTTLSTQIGTKVAKAGDTMTGALTLSGAPSSANHAATKAYVDTSVSGGTGALDTDDITEAGNLYFTNTRVDARIPTNVSSFANDSGYLTSVGTINYNDLSNKPTIPTNNNQLTNGAGYITSFTDTNTTYTAGNGLTLSGTEFLMSGNYTGSFTASGDVTAYSDERLKSDITTIEDALNKVKNLRGVMFDKTDTLSSELKRSTGVIAQEVEKVLPEVVHNDINTGYKSVAYGNIVGVLIEAIKEQQEQIDKLKHDIEFLKGIRRN